MTKETPLVDEQLKDTFRGGGDTLKAWGAALKEKRDELTLTREQLAQLAATTQQTIARIEHGQLNPRDYTKVAIARSLGCETEDIFAWPRYEAVAAEFGTAA